MKKSLFIVFLSVFMLYSVNEASAQSNCDLSLSTNFDSECLLTEYIKDSVDLLEEESEECILACKGNTVEYYANCTSGVQYTWTISGEVSYILHNQGKTAIVTWGNGDIGHISVNVVTSDTNSCTAELCVLLMESPEVACATVPAFYIDPQGDKRIEICLGETIDFMDMSTVGTTPIVGYFWNSPYGSAASQNYTITPTQTGEFKVQHQVQNECGCEDEEVILVTVTKPAKLKLSCYGAVCEGSTVTYSIIDPPCSQYYWHIEGGIITQGQNTPDITVEWGSPSSGYGVLSIDASFCDTPCNGLISVKIPVISQNVEISGPDTVCVGDILLYDLPLWAATNYTWSMLPTIGYNFISYEYPNQYMVQFSQPGDYELTSSYECTFLECGPFLSATKNIIVRDTLVIYSDNGILCKGDTGIFTSNHQGNVLWKVFNKNGQLVLSCSIDTLYWSTDTSNQYTITASHPDYCKTAEFFVTVKENPPALTTTNGPHEACPGSAIKLSALSTHPNFYLSWKPICSSATPFSSDGDDFTVNYGNEVCDVAVYQIDKEYGCKSKAFIHIVDTFQLAPLGLPDTTFACAGSIVTLSVPNQSANVTYEWIIYPANAASVIGDHLAPTIHILTNHLTNTATPYMVYLRLKRTYCSNMEVYETVKLLIENVTAPTLSYPDTACLYDNVPFTATGGTTSANHYTWHFGNEIYHGNCINKYFSTRGYHTFTLDYQPNPNCSAVTVGGTIYINPIPNAFITQSGSNLSVAAQQNVTYNWSFNGTPLSCQTSICPVVGQGTYCCTVTGTIAPYCSATNCYSNLPSPDTCISFTFQPVSVDCDEAVVTANNPTNVPISWHIMPSHQGDFCNPDHSLDSTTAHFNNVGTFSVVGSMVYNGQCYRGTQQVTINCIPDFDLTYNCNGSLVITDRSVYNSGYSIPVRTFTVMGTSLTGTINYPSTTISIPTQSLAAGTYNILMTMANSSCAIIKPIALEPNPVINSINIPDFMCANTPFLFSATTSGTITNYHWNFGDYSYNFGNSIYHSFESRHLPYNVTLTVSNALGCTATANKQVTVAANDLNGALTPLSTTIVCPGTPRLIRYYPLVSQATYTWNPGNITNTSNLFPTYQTGDYRVKVLTNQFGCKVERMCNVGFLNTPTARITGSTAYCFGEEVILLGNNGSTNTYSWVISGPQSFSFTTANAKFIPTIAGNYTATLTVTNNDGCSASATYHFVIHQLPPAPAIAFYGNQCIHTPPVGTQSNNGQNLFWSNGYFGTTAYYYSDGYISAHYVDPTTGCPSDNAFLFIPPAPNYDALLTGCYKMCKNQFTYLLPVYHFYPLMDAFKWNWLHNGSVIDSGNGNNYNIQVPIVSDGDYFIETIYGNNCVAPSPVLTIEEDKVCPCDSIVISKYTVNCYFQECQLFYSVSFQICNYGTQAVTFDQFFTNSNNQIIGTSQMPLTLYPGDCDTFSFNMIFNNYPNTWAEFILFDPELNCEKTFRIEFDYNKCIEEGCFVEEFNMDFNPSISTPHQTSYFDFQMTLQNTTSYLVALWSDPSQILNYTYSPPVGVNGLLMLDYGILSQMNSNAEDICFHAIICVADSFLCHAVTCIPAYKFFDEIPDDYKNFSDNFQKMKIQKHVIFQKNNKPYLVPNPAHNMIQIMGIEPDDLSEILILNMNGKQLEVIKNNSRFDVSRLAKAAYIVRIITVNKEVYYLKFVKQ